MRIPALLLCLLPACGEAAPTSPSDDPDDYQVDTTVSYEVQVSAPRWVVPSPALPADAAPMAANNNVDIALYSGRLFLAWRTAESHFASTKARMVIVSSPDGGVTWEYEHTVALGADVREPRFLVVGDRLLFHLFEAGTSPLAFEPRRMWRTEREGLGRWSALETFGRPKSVQWTVKWRRGRALMTSYLGEHYNLDEPGMIDVLLDVSDDGIAWQPLGGPVYHGGVSEAAFELDAQGGLWAVTRNEDGDQTGFGAHVCHAPADDLAAWDCPTQSDPERYDSPWLFRHGEEIYLVARRDVGGPFDQGLDQLSFAERKKRYLLDYSLRPKRTALYLLDRAARRIVHLRDLPSAGDTAFPSVRRTGPHTFVVANYTSPLDRPEISWLEGQTSSKGTQIYLVDLTFVPRP